MTAPGLKDVRVIFAGPSAPPDLRRDEPGLRFLPPVRFGDVARATDAGVSAIGIIDGVFESERSVWHREILFALKRGVPVFGAASMGALRALETEAFGMQGLGTVFDWYRQGAIEDDEEVAVRHAPAELNYRPLTEATVNVRAGLLAALAAGTATAAEADRALRIAQTIHYKDRSRRALLTRLEAEAGLEALAQWLANNWVDRKGQDAALLIGVFRQAALPSPGKAPNFQFRETVHWRRFRHTGA